MPGNPSPKGGGVAPVQAINRPIKKLSPGDYNVAWICALALEMSAARAMLDEEHLQVDTSPKDDNVYVLGSISGHNVAITCLPEGVYGTTSAALVAKDMCSTFPSITMPLLVGIGGGVPQPGFDIRLGDVVIGSPSSEHPAVIQYDYGKTEAAGVLVPKGSTNKPASSLLRAVSSLISKHQLRTKDMSFHMTRGMESSQLAQELFKYPDAVADILFESGCDHVPEGSVCPHCKPVEPIVRSKRITTEPAVFYGTIASGNQVMKHGYTRDKIALGSGKRILCFEMEAAGVIDVLPCLVIRGICDYCDSQKHKQFQGYAALSAAAYAKELLSVIPNKRCLSMDSTNDDATRLEHRKKMMQALRVETAENHQATVKRAHPQTCDWLPKHINYEAWRDLLDIPKHHGLLWVKGKPGVGKSVTMKYLMQAIKQSGYMTISFFFNARGQQDGSSTAGMYKSLSYQLLSLSTDLQELLDGITLPESSKPFDEYTLRTLFQRLVTTLGTQDLFCFIDALDEGFDEEEIRNMLDVFEDLGDLTASGSLKLRACFSSRHYPHITLRSSLQIVLDGESGHANDIDCYLGTELGFGNHDQFEAVKEEIMHKSSGVFLWVFLVVRMLKREYDRGRVQKKTMLDRLNEIPADLERLFREMLSRDNENVEELQLCIRFVLYAARPLNRRELYYALLTGCSPDLVGPWDQKEITQIDMTRYLLNCSKGLIEFTDAKEPTARFIHESVRECLIGTDLLSIWPDFLGFDDEHSFEILKATCERYIMITSNTCNELVNQRCGLGDGPSSIHRAVVTMLPFLEHAARYVLYYSGKAHEAGHSQDNFLHDFSFATWKSVYNATQKWRNEQLSAQTTLRSILDKFGCRQPLRCLASVPPPKRRYKPRKFYLLGASRDVSELYPVQNRAMTVEAILSTTTSWRDAIDDMQNSTMNQGYPEVPSDLPLLHRAASQCLTAQIQRLLNKDGDVDRQDGSNRTALMYIGRFRGSQNYDTITGMLLILRGAKVNSRDKYGQTPLHHAVSNRCIGLIELLLQQGAEVNASDLSGRTPVDHAFGRQGYEIQQMLLRHGARRPSRAPALSIDAQILLWNKSNSLVEEHTVINDEPAAR